MVDIKKLILLLAMLILIPTATAPVWYGSGDNTGLVGKWSCEGNFLDSSGQGNHGTQSGGVTITRGVKGTACGFDGAGDYITSSLNSSVLGSNITYAAWIYVKGSAGTYRGIITSDQLNPAYNGLNLVVPSDNTISMCAMSGGSYLYVSTPWTVSANTWYYVVGVHDSSNNNSLYVNGKLEKSGVQAVTQPGNYIKLGRFYTDSDAYYFNGVIDEARIYNRTLSASEILALYNTSKSYHVEFKSYPTISGNNETPAPTLTDETGLVGYWKMDDLTNGNTTDSSGGDNNGSITGTTIAYTSNGRWNGAYAYNGASSNYIRVNDAPALDFGSTGNFTLAAWFKYTTTGNAAPIAGKGDSIGTAQDKYGFRFTAATTLCGDLADGTNGGQCLVTWTTPYTVYDNKWHFGAFSINRETMNASGYLDGSLLGRKNITAIGNIDSTGWFGIGAFPGAGSFNGTIDEVRLYNRTLSDSEIQELYLSKGLVGKWSFDANNKNATDTYDSSGYYNHGKITGATLTNEGRFKEAYKFDGTNDVINITSSRSLNLTGNITISAWIKTSYSGGSQTILAKINPADPWNGYTYNIGGSTNNNKLSFWNGNYPSYAWVSADSTYNDGAWHLATITMLNTNVTFYKDGVFDGTQVTGTRTTSSPNDLWIGVEQSTPRRFNGTIDDVRIYNRALTSSEVAGLYNGTKTFHLTFSSMPAEGMSNETPAPTASNEIDLILYLKMDDLTNSNTTDSSGRGNNGSVYQAVLNTSGRWGKTYTFDGSDDYIRLLNDINLPNTNWTTTAWVKTSDPNAAVFGNWNGDPTDSGLWIKAGLISYAHYTGAWAYSNGTSNVSDERWHFLTWAKRDIGTGSANKVMDFYVDGIAETTAAPAATTASGPMNQFGRDWGNALTGLIDEVRIYNRSLSAAEIQELYLSKGLVGYWKMDANNRNATDTYDISGYNNYGKISEAVLTNEGKFKEGYKFDGVNDKVDVSITSSVNITGNITISTWIKSPGTSKAYQSINTHCAVGLCSYWLGTVTATDSLRVYLSGDGAIGPYRGKSGAGIIDNKWHHISMAYNGTGVSLYKDGIELVIDETSGTVPSSLFTTSNNIRFGYDYANGDNAAFNGTIDEVKIYNRALTATEIGQLYNGTKSEHLTWWSVPG